MTARLQGCISFDSYIKPQLCIASNMLPPCCISFDSYIKPQLFSDFFAAVAGCISFDSYIKPQLLFSVLQKILSCISFDSYINPQLKPKPFLQELSCISFDSYIKPQPLITCIPLMPSCISFDSYIKPQRSHPPISSGVCCISFDSYIKPQRTPCLLNFLQVVYLLIPTSNHNSVGRKESLPKLYIFWFLHQTTTQLLRRARTHLLYIFWFLHQTTTFSLPFNLFYSCISFDSYIKPQPITPVTFMCRVVYLLIPTSNHNRPPAVSWLTQLYIFWFLHQTTTPEKHEVKHQSCISFDSYIKPQP